MADLRAVGRGAADLAVLGVPYDGAAPGREGSAEGPTLLRAASVQSFAYREDPDSGYPIGALDLDRGGPPVLRGTRIVDLGDLRIDAERGPEAVSAQVADAVAAIRGAGTLPVVLGGDHSISYGVVDGLARAGPLGILHVDAHLDLAPGPGHDLTHATWVSHARRLPGVDHLVQLGVRGWQPIPRAAGGVGDAVDGPGLLRQLGVDQVVGGLTLDRWASRGGSALPCPLPDLAGWHVTIDIDVLDPGVAPGTGVPVPLGPSPAALRAALEAILTAVPVIGIDLTEVNGRDDGRTAGVAAAILVDLVSWASRGPSPGG